MFRFRLSARLILFSTTIVILATAVLSSVVYLNFKEEIHQQILENLNGAAEHKALDFKSVLEFEKTNLLAWRSSSVMVDVVVDDLDKRIYQELINLKKQYQLHGHLYVFNQQGVLIASTQEGVLGQTIPAFWADGITSYHFVFRHQVDFVDETLVAHIAPLTPPQLPNYGTMVLTHPWQDVDQLFEPGDIRYGLTTNNKTALELFTQTGIQTIEEGVDHAAHSFSLNEEHFIAAISQSVTIDDFAYQVFAYKPEQSAKLPLQKLLNKLLVAAISVCAPLVFIVSLLSRRFTQPIHKLTSTIRRIQQSTDLNTQLKTNVVVKGHDEVAELAVAFNRMTQNLADAFAKQHRTEQALEVLNANLENQVKDRTAELQQALKKLQSAQAQLVQSEKMISLGQLVAGIAHEINNPVGAIYANMPVLEEYIEDINTGLELSQQFLTAEGQARIQKHLEEIDFEFIMEDLHHLISSQRNAAERIKNIVAALRNFSRLDQGELKSVYIEEGIDSSLQMLHHQYKNRIVIERDYQLNSLVECYAGELNQVFMNILANAVQAIPGEGIIRIATAQQADNAVVTIQDSGVGMPEEVRAKIFDPFFTTKAIGEGTGLGLSISYGIIEKHRGDLTVHSTVGEGTQFIVTIPLRQDKEP